MTSAKRSNVQKRPEPNRHIMADDILISELVTLAGPGLTVLAWGLIDKYYKYNMSDHAILFVFLFIIHKDIYKRLI